MSEAKDEATSVPPADFRRLLRALPGDTASGRTSWLLVQQKKYWLWLLAAACLLSLSKLNLLSDNLRLLGYAALAIWCLYLNLVFLASVLPTARLAIPPQGRYWLMATLALLGMGWLKGINLLLLLGYLMLVVWGVNFALAGRHLKRLQARRCVDRPVFAQDSFTVSIEVFNPQQRALFGFWIEDRSPAGEASWFLVRLRRQEAARWQREIALPRRGAYPWPALAARSGYPFGLVQRVLPLTPAEETIVLPRLGRLHRGRLRRFLSFTEPLADRFRSTPRAAPLDHTDFHGLRPFRSGDSPRWIHWRTSARRGELMVREYENATTDNLILVLDLCVDPEVPNLAGEPAPWTRDPTLLLERAVSLAATICWEWCRQKGDRLLLAVSGSAPLLWEGLTSRALALQMLEGLAVQTAEKTTDVEAFLEQFHGRLLPAGPVLLVSTRRGGLDEKLAGPLRRPVATVYAADLNNVDFYELPGSGTGSPPAGART
jgi:uncharacterized protein (DUF58 family)